MTYYTENLSEFGHRELQEGGELLQAAWPKNFADNGVRLAFNKGSGYVFLVNDDYQVAMFNGDNVEMYHSTPYHGHEGFITDLLDEYEPDELNQDDIDYILDNAEIEGAELPAAWDNYKQELEAA